MNSKVMNKVLSFLLAVAMVFTSFSVPANAATAKTLGKGKIASMTIMDGVKVIENKGTVYVPVAKGDQTSVFTKVVSAVFEDKSGEPTHEIKKIKLNKKAKKMIKVTKGSPAATGTDITIETIAPATNATGAMVTVISKDKNKKNKPIKAKFYVELQEYVPVTAVTISDTAPNAGDTLTATPDPKDAVVSYQWTLNGEPILDATEATFTIPAEAEAGAKYNVTVTDLGGASVTAAEDAVVGGLNLKGVSIDNLAPNAGDTINVVFDPVDANNVESIQWVCGDLYVEGETNAAFTIPAEVEAGVRFNVLVKDSNGTEFTAPADAVVGGAALESVSLSNTAPEIGDEIAVIFDPIDADDIESCQWTKNGEDIENATEATFVVPEDAVAGDVFNVVVTTTKGGIFTAETPAVVGGAVLTGVSLDIENPMVGDTLTAIIEPENASNVSEYNWEALNTADADEGTSIGASSSVMITENEEGKFIRVTVTDQDGNTFVSPVSAAVKKDNTSSVVLNDKNGFQSDGTALVYDTLRLSYGSGLGIPALITWYYNDTVVKSQTSQADEIDSILELLINGTTCKDGDYYVVITNTEGETYESNHVTAVFDPLSAEISNMTLTDDYKNASNIALKAQDDEAVATITMKKAYPGDFYVYENSITNYTNSNYSWKFDDFDPTDYDSESSFDKMTEENAKKLNIIKFVAANGETTLMFDTNDVGQTKTTPVRGKSYKLVFDQDGIESDNIKSVARTDIETTEANELAYLVAPAKVEFITAASGTGAVVNLLDEEDNILDYIGDPTNGVAIPSTGGNGFDSFKIYGNTKASATGAIKLADSGIIKAGVFTSTDIAAVSAYNYAEAKTTAGVFGADGVTITSGFKAKNVPVAEKVTLKENGTTASQADIEIDSLVAPSKVYVVSKADLGKQEVDNWSPDNSSTYRGYTDVKPGDGTATIANVFAKDDIGDVFTAYIVPDDTATYAQIESETMTLKQVATSLEYSEGPETPDLGDATCVGGDVLADSPNQIDLKGNDNVVVKDQFGQVIDSADYFDTITDAKATVVASDAGGTYPEAGSATYTIDKDIRSVDVKLTSTAGIDLGDGFEVSLLGSTFKITASTDLDTYKDFTVKLGSDTLVTPSFADATTATVTNSADLVAALAGADMVTVTIGKSFTTAAPVSVAATQTVEIPAGITLTTGDAFTLNNTATLDNDGTFVVGKGKTLTIDAANSDLDDNDGDFEVSDSTALATLVGATNFNAGSKITVKESLVTPAAGLTLENGIINVPEGVTLTTGGDVTLDGAAELAGAGNIDLEDDTLTVTDGTISFTGTITAFDGAEFAATADDANLDGGVVFTISSEATDNGVEFTDSSNNKTDVVKYGPTAPGSAAIDAVAATAIDDDTSRVTREGKVTITNDNTNVKIAIAGSAAIPAAE